MESGPFDLQPVRPDGDRFMGRWHVSAGAHRGQPPERGISCLVGKNYDDTMLKRNLITFCVCSPRQEGSLRWPLWGSWSVWSGICMENITSGNNDVCVKTKNIQTVHMSSLVDSVFFCIRLLLFLYLLYIGTFTLCCAYRPLKDAPENYTKPEMDKTIRVQKTLDVC